MQELFKAAVERGASDIHIKAGDFIRARVHGDLQPLTQQKLSPDQVKGIALKLIPHEEDRDNFDKLLDYDCSWGLPGVGRFRVNIMKQRGSPMIVMRAIPIEIPTVEDLGLPAVINKIAASRRGMILVTGVTGSGKSSTMAAMINWMNANRKLHVVTLENPIEFLHRDNQCSITQRDIGTDTDSFESGLRSVLRQDPDVILIGEMRDKVTIETALKAAETGHLVISTLHTKNAVQTISRIIAVFDPNEQEMIRVRLSESLQAVISQRLVQKKLGGRVAAMEVMLVTSTIRDCIRDADRMEEIPDLIEEGRDHYGSQSFDQHLMELVQSDLVDFELAKAAANNPADFDLKMNMFGDPKEQAAGPGASLQDEMTNMMGELSAMIDLGGTFLPVTTPFDPVTGDVDVVAFRSNVRQWCEQPISGILIAGSTGESVFLDGEERVMLIEAACDVVPDEGLVIAGTGAESTRHAIRNAKEAADAGADAILVSPPAYFKGAMTPEVLVAHYRALADKSPLPVMIYQVPLRLSTLEFPIGVVAELSQHPNIVGIKDSRGKLDLVGELVENTADDFQVLVGSGAILYGALELGAVGGIVAVGLMATKGAAEISVAFQDGRASDAGRIQERIAPVHNQIVGGMGVPGIKAALDMLGLHGGAPRPPLTAVSEERWSEIRTILDDADLLEKAPA